MKMKSRPRVLVIAEAANPEWVSVPLIGWSLARALTAVADVHVVTQVRNRDAFLRAGMIEGQDFTSIDTEAVARPLWRAAEILRLGSGRGWTTVQAINALAYPSFERLVWRTFEGRLRAGAFDLVHRITPLTPIIASPIAKRCAAIGVPFVLGPINGGVRWPKEFASARRREREFLSHVRNAYKLLPGQKSMLTNCAAILVGSRTMERDVPLRYREKCVYLPENAVDLGRFHERDFGSVSEMRACFIGRMVPLKGPDVLIEASEALLRSGRLKLDMIGDGPMLPELRALVEQHGLSEAVAFHGWVPHSNIEKIAGQSTIFAFPSIREFGGGAVLEAMAMGLVPVVVDYAGPSELVSADIGIKIPLGSREQVVAGFAAALESLVNDPPRARSLSRLARKRVEAQFSWPRKAEQVGRVYDWVRGEATKPELLCDG